MTNESAENIPFSPILIMEFVRQVTVNRFLNGETAVKFKLAKAYYEEIKTFPLKAQTIHLDIAYDDKTEILTVKADETVVNRFKEQKALTEIAGKYENQYADRYKQFITVTE